MSRIKLFEEFTYDTIKLNNSEYIKHLHSSTTRNDAVAWNAIGSQERNFKLVEEYINQNDTLLDYGCGIGDLIPYLENNGKQISDYLGVDINPAYIKIAKESYPKNNFKLIKSVDAIKGKWDTICAIGVFTWYIKKEEFIDTINTLLDISNKQVLLTCLIGSCDCNDDEYWKETYRFYNPAFFIELFPELNFEFKRNENTLLVKILK